MMDATPHNPALCLCGAKNVNAIGTGVVLAPLCATTQQRTRKKQTDWFGSTALYLSLFNARAYYILFVV